MRIGMGFQVLMLAAASVAAQGKLAGDGALPPAEVRALVERAIAAQLRNDAALTEYERREQVTRRNGANEKVSEEKLYRVVPTGTGTLRLVLEEGGRAVQPELYARQLRDLETALNEALRPEEPRQKERIEKWKRRTRERRQRIEAIREAFFVTATSRENRDGRTLVKLALEPDPKFVPRTKPAELLVAVRATAWVEEATGQVAQVEAELVRDISFGGGLLGKVYRGGRMVLEQAEAAPGVWLPVRYEFHLQGRRFVFGFEQDEVIQVSRYRRIGPPREALAAVRGELGTAGAAQATR